MAFRDAVNGGVGQGKVDRVEISRDVWRSRVGCFLLVNNVGESEKVGTRGVRGIAEAEVAPARRRRDRRDFEIADIVK